MDTSHDVSSAALKLVPLSVTTTCGTLSLVKNLQKAVLVNSAVALALVVRKTPGYREYASSMINA